MAMVPITQFANTAYLGIFMLGWVFHLAAFSKLIWIVIAIFAVITAFQLITLPVEFDASRRAKEQLFRLGIVRTEEAQGVNRVLNAAALTYVAALVASALQLVRLLTIARDRN